MGKRRALVLAGISAVAAAPGLIWYFGIRGKSQARPALPSIVVLPFANLSGDKENEYFSDGMTEEVINALANVEGVRVVARTSAFSFKGKNVDVRKIGEQLSVAPSWREVTPRGQRAPGIRAAHRGRRRVSLVVEELRPRAQERVAIPLVIAISTTLAAQSGLLVRNRRGLEEARNLNAVVFDKTGTLTKGEFGVVDIVTADGLAPDQALRLAAAVEADSEHAIAQGIVRAARDRGLAVPRAEAFEAIPGMGAKARVDGTELYVGGPALLAARSLGLPPALREAADRAARRGQAAIYLADEGKVLAVLAVADVLRAESKEAVHALHQRKIEVVMMTGDARPVAEAVAAELGIDTVFAEVLPEQKASKIEELKSRGKRVAMVGDGVNDAAALVTADVGVAIGAGTDVAVEAGDIVVVLSDPRDVPRIITLSRANYRKMIQNLWWTAGYNIVAIPLAAGVLARYGFVLSPAIGAVLMFASTLVVAINAQLLRRVQV